MSGFFLFLGCGALYFLPTLLGQKKRNAGAIFTLNLLLGWTLIGWVVAMVWAMTVDPPEVVLVREGPPAAVPRYCTKCGTPVAIAAQYCGKCGMMAGR